MVFIASRVRFTARSSNTRGCSFAHFRPGVLTQYGHLLREPFERMGLFNDTVFSCGHVDLGDGRIRLYYGAADCRIGT